MTRDQANARARNVILALSAVALAFILTIGVGLNRFSTLVQNEIAIAAAGRSATFAASILARDPPPEADTSPASGPMPEPNIQRLAGVFREYVVAGEDGRVTSSSRSEDMNRSLPSAAMLELREGGVISSSVDALDGASMPIGVATAYAPVIRNDEVIGYVGVRIDRSADTQDVFRQLQFGYFAFALLFAGFSIPTGAALYRYLQRRFVLEFELERKSNDLSFGESVGQIGYWSMPAPDGHVDLSPEASRLLGRAQNAELAGVGPFAALFGGQDVARIASGLRDVLAGTLQEFRTETSIADSDGGLHDLRLVARGRGTGSKAGLFGVVVDITAEKTFRRSLRESESKFRLLADNASDLLVFFGRDRLIKYISPSASRIIGYQPDELVGTDIFARVHPEDRALLMARYGEDFAEGMRKFSGPALWRMMRRDGVYVWLESTGTLIQDAVVPGGYQVVSISRDVTDRVEREAELKRVQAALEESEVTFRLLAENASDIISFYDGNRVLKYVSPSVTRLTGYRPDELLGKSGLLTVHPDDVAVLKARRDRVLEGKPAEIATWRMRHKNGNYIWMESSVTIIDVPGRAQEIVSIARDVSERVEREAELRRMQAALQESEVKFRMLAENSSDIISFYDINRKLQYVSPSVEYVTGYKPAEVIGGDAFALVHPDDAVALTERRGLAGGNAEPGVATWRLRHKDGHYLWMESSVTIIEKPGSDVQIVSIARNISERVERENALKAAQARLQANAEELRILAQERDLERQRAESANAAKSRFLATMSHELRTPMTGIIGMADLLQGSNLTPEQDKQAQLLGQSARILLDLLNDILDLSKIESGKFELENTNFRLTDIFREAHEIVAHAASAKGIAVITRREDWPVPDVNGDPKHLRQILLNLMGNAVKFTSEGQVRVEAGQKVVGDDVWLTVSVSDTGIGISPENQRRLFQPFTQADTTTARRFGGTGLGLSIAKHLAEAMGGDIAVTSEPGKGSTFTFRVRLKKATGAVQRGSNAAVLANPSPTRPLRILVAEDTDTTRYLIAAMLERAGHSVVAVEDGEAAITEARAGRFDIMLIDMHMPVIDGPEAIAIIRATVKHAKQTPIIALTADIVAESRARYLESGATTVVGKPVDWAALHAEMARLTAGTAPVAPPTAAEAPSATGLNDGQLQELEAVLGPGRLKGLLGNFATNLKQYDRDLTDALAARDLIAIKRKAHAIRGLAAQFGAGDVAQLARHTEEDLTHLDAFAAIAPKLKEAMASAVADAERRSAA